MPFRAVWLSQNQSWCPLRLKAAKVLGSLLDMNFDGDETVVYEVCDAFLRINLGIQPSAAASHRRGAKIKQRHLS